MVRSRLTYVHGEGKKESTNIKRGEITIAFTHPNPKQPLRENPSFSHTKEERRSRLFLHKLFALFSDLKLAFRYLSISPTHKIPNPLISQLGQVRVWIQTVMGNEYWVIIQQSPPWLKYPTKILHLNMNLIKAELDVLAAFSKSPNRLNPRNLQHQAI